MKRRSVFTGYHPAVALVWFGGVLLFTMFCRDPACLAVSFLCAAVLRLYLGAEGIRVRYLLAAALLTAAVNPLFNRRGDTVLFLLPWGWEVTLESAAYGLTSGLLLAAALLWFSCWERIFPADEFLSLSARRAPALSLTLSMALRSVPRAVSRFREVLELRRMFSAGLEGGPLSRRMKNAGTVLRAVTAWTLEDGAVTADSMNARGYGLPGRTAYSTRRFTLRDGVALAVSGGLLAFLLWGVAAGGFSAEFWPRIALRPVSPPWVFLRGGWLLLCLLPLLLAWGEAGTYHVRKRQYLKRKEAHVRDG